ncbi:hypothetical protein IFM89_003004 [Coptis chinensis]|uniref:CCHC-type domain-containing protein n=1 Tax=Coptis chinensis TaxID=261450 RepID=A0A835IQT7_9MAGN|nr:hypothetical protein IFM89_003004 [Coptis chinensis]
MSISGLERVFYMPDCNRAVWKEKFIAGLPNGLGDLVRSRLKEDDLDLMTFGELFVAVDQLLIERCTQKKRKHSSRRPSKGGKERRCYKCNKIGHYAKDCKAKRVGAAVQDQEDTSQTSDDGQVQRQLSQQFGFLIIQGRSISRWGWTGTTGVTQVQRKTAARSQKRTRVSRFLMDWHSDRSTAIGFPVQKDPVPIIQTRRLRGWMLYMYALPGSGQDSRCPIRQPLTALQGIPYSKVSFHFTDQFLSHYAARLTSLFCIWESCWNVVKRNSASSSPSDPDVKKVADKLASFVAKNGRQFEHFTRQRNHGDTPFNTGLESIVFNHFAQRDLVMISSREDLIGEKDKNQCFCLYNLVLQQHLLCAGVFIFFHTICCAGSSNTSGFKASNGFQKNQSNYQTPASALYEANKDTPQAGSNSYGERNAPSASDPIAITEFYMKKAAHEEWRRQPKQSKDEMPPPASLHAASGKKGHHMGDYIPLEELEKFMANCNDVAAQKAAKEAAERSKIQADNVGHKLLSKMGWKEGDAFFVVAFFVTASFSTK